MYELFIEGQKADINDQISVQLTFAIDDVANFASRETTFSKQIVLPGTGNNNTIFGHIAEMGSNNPYSPGQPNIGAAFNVAQTSRAELRLNGLLVLRGVFRLTGIIKEGEMLEYEGALFGELSGLMSEISNKKLEDLDFSTYDHVLSHTTISNSWDNAGGSGYFYPLIDYGLYRETAVISGLNDDYEIGTFRPALYVKEYIDKMFTAAGYSYTSTFFNTSYFKSLIIPYNVKELSKLDTRQLRCERRSGSLSTIDNTLLSYVTAIGGNFIISGTKDQFTYNIATPINGKCRFTLNCGYTITGGVEEKALRISINKNGNDLYIFEYSGEIGLINIDFSFEEPILQNDVFEIRVFSLNPELTKTVLLSRIISNFYINVDNAIPTLITSGDTVPINETIPKGIFQKDFLASIIKMFNLYIYEDKENEKKLNIVPYVDFMSATDIDWTYKIARDKSWQISPMGNLNARIFEYKYKEDSDFYNESYKKKFNQNYADRQFDTGFQFSNDKQTTDIIFASSPLIQYESSDKYVVPVYKKSNELLAEDRMDSNIRILFSKKKSANSWNIMVGGSNFAKTFYGYAGHLDDPITPTQDLNFGAPSEVYFTAGTYPSTNLFNRFWSGYIAQIADKDSKILRCYVYLKPVDIAQLDFANPIFIDGVRFRLNKITDYDYTNNDLVQVELLKIIENG
jgi:hypothetical protein